MISNRFAWMRKRHSGQHDLLHKRKGVVRSQWRLANPAFSGCSKEDGLPIRLALKTLIGLVIPVPVEMLEPVS